jgi:ketosteroid isomerase-like protein
LLAGLALLGAGGTRCAEAQRGKPAHAERRNARHEIEQMEERWRLAILDHDGKALEGLLSDDFSGISVDGALQTREELVARISSGTLNISSLMLSERKVRIYGGTAVVTSVAEVTGNRGEDEVTGRYRYTRVYVRNAQGQWKIVNFEASRIREPGERKSGLH